MHQPSEREALRRIRRLFESWLDPPPSFEQSEEEDLVVRSGSATLVIEYKGNAGTALVVQAAEQARAYAKRRSRSAVPLVAVPFMGDAGREVCREAKVAWLDLAGNAEIRAPGMLIRVEGKPNLFKRSGRPSTVFSPRSSRIARVLLLHSNRAWRQRDLAVEAQLDEGYTSRVVRRMEDDRLVVRNDDGELRITDPQLVLDAWREEYDFSKHEIIRGHVAARTSGALLRELQKALPSEHAFTGLAAAWQFTKFAAFRLVTVFVNADPHSAALDRIGFNEEARGANVWLVRPSDDGVFHDAREVGGIRCVHPVQVFLDLKGQPERSEEAAESLKPLLFEGTEH